MAISEALSLPLGEAVFTEFDASRNGCPGRRSDPRYSVDLDVSLGSEHNFYGGFAENLSPGGVFVATHLVKPVGQPVEFSIHFSGSKEAVKGFGEVRWIREYNDQSDVPPGIGIRFLELDPGANELIATFLDNREPLFYDDD